MAAEVDAARGGGDVGRKDENQKRHHREAGRPGVGRQGEPDGEGELEQAASPR